MDSDDKWVLAVIMLILFLVITIGGGLMFSLPVYNVWRMGKHGEALLRQAEQEKLIMVEQAKAEVEAAEFRAKAIALVGQSAKEFPEYRQQEFIAAFAEAIKSDSVEQIIYVPTEANLPIVEAGRIR